MINDESENNTDKPDNNSAPTLENNPESFMSENHEVDLIINLSNLTEDDAIQRVNAEIKNANKKKLKKIWFSFELAAGNGQTLFQPIGKTLRDKIKTGEIIRAMPAANGGWIARIK